jgi:2-deoxy-D-gluconate 3-dehydrogenase
MDMLVTTAQAYTSSTTSRRFDGKTCLVTGGSRGIGEAIARALATAGGTVGVLSRSAQDCTRVAGGLGDEALAIPADVGDVRSCGRALSTFCERVGQLDVVVHAAGISPVYKRLEDVDPAIAHEVIDVNLVGTLNLLHVAFPLLARDASVILIASAVSLAGSARLSAYGASKAAVIQLGRTLAREWGSRPARVNVVCPGYVPTDLTHDLLGNEHLRDEILSCVPLRRLATLDEIVAPVLFLASAESAYVTGAMLTVDGGLTA